MLPVFVVVVVVVFRGGVLPRPVRVDLQAKEMAEIASENAKRARELKKSVAKTQKAAGKKQRNRANNQVYEKEKAKLAAASEADRKNSMKAAHKHEKEVAKKAAELDASVHEYSK